MNKKQIILLVIVMIGVGFIFTQKYWAGFSALTETEARGIAEKTCIKGGEALGVGIHNEGTKTWWFDANLNATREGCNPACVVSEDTKQVEINWRCTGSAEN